MRDQIALEADRFGEHDATSAHDLGAIEEAARIEGLVLRGTAEGQDLAVEQYGVLVGPQPRLAAQTGAVEQDRALRHDLEPGAGETGEGEMELGFVAARAVDLLRGLPRHAERRAVVRLDRQREAIAADDATRGVRDHDRPRVAELGVRPQEAQRRFLAQGAERRLRA
ncbi:MAG: hypothetical protein R3F21_05025 [Myxococcota bacterium]